MTVDPDSAAGSYEFKGQTYHFCSTHCLHEFREDPERFLNKPAKPMMAQPVGIQHAKTFPLLLIGMSEFIPGADVEWLERLVRRQQSL
jgi:YHS domain-containing protein